MVQIQKTANEIRRFTMKGLASVAIDVIGFQHNQSLMKDEELALRLGQIPISFDPDLLSEAVSGVEDEHTTLVFTLDRIGQFNGDLVSSGDLCWLALGDQAKRMSPVINPEFPIVRLRRGQRITFRALATRGTMAVHAKWQAVNVTYENGEHIIQGTDRTINLELHGNLTFEQIVRQITRWADEK